MASMFKLLMVWKKPTRLKFGIKLLKKTMKMMKRIMTKIQINTTMKHLLLLICTFCTITATAQKKWTLKACVDHALKNNISVKQSENSLLTNDQDIIAAKGNFLPSLSMNGSQRLNLGNV